MLVGSGLFVISTREFLAVARSADGTVIRMEYKRTGFRSNSGSYLPHRPISSANG